MNAFFSYLTATTKASYFSHDAAGFYKNTGREALISCLIPLFACLYNSLVFCAYHVCRYDSAPAFMGSYIYTFGVLMATALPKFLIFFGLTWQLCRIFKQTEYFYAFVAANNWFYIPYIFLYSLKVFVIMNADITQEHVHVFRFVSIFYLTMVVNFLAHNVLRLRQEIAWIVPIFFLLAHTLVFLVTGRHGMILVF